MQPTRRPAAAKKFHGQKFSHPSNPEGVDSSTPVRWYTQTQSLKKVLPAMIPRIWPNKEISAQEQKGLNIQPEGEVASAPSMLTAG